MLSQSEFLWYHALIEMFAATISFGVFLIAWDTRRFARSTFFVTIGPAFALVGLFDILHMLAYKGMGTNVTGTADLPTQLWVAARFTEVLAVLAGVLLAGRPLRPTVPLAATVLYGAVLLASITQWHLFPSCYVEGVGLTPFKVGAEYVFVTLKLVTGAALWGNRHSFDQRAARWLGGYLAISALSELTFTGYISVYDGVIQTGHVLKVIAFLAVYAATSRAVLRRPYGALFGDLQAARETLERTVVERTQELVEANHLLTTLIDSSPLAIFANDTAGRVILWNAGAERIYGWTAEEALGRPLQTAPPDQQAEQNQLIRQVLDGTPVVGQELLRQHKDGRVLAVRDYAAPLRAADGTIRGLVSVVMDITAERAAERAAREGEERLRGLMANVPDAIMTVNEWGVIETASAAAERLFGYTAAELIGNKVNLLMPPELAAVHDSFIIAHGRSGQSELVGRGSREMTACHRDGRAVPIDMALNEMWVDGRRIYVAVLRDISDRLRERTRKAAMERELQRAQKMEALGNLAGGIAHEVNNMLTPILGLSEVALLRLPEDSPVRHNLEKVVEAAGRARDILRKLLAFGRADTALPMPLPLCSLMEETLPLVRAAVTLEVGLNCVFPEEDLVAHCALTEFQQIMMNLCTNAGQAVVGPDGRIEIALCRQKLGEDRAMALGLRPGDHAMLTVSDNGTGMDSETADKIFEPFFTTKPVGDGTGLGLSVVHAIVLSWGGAITVDTAPGLGATFRIYLPLAETMEISVV